MDTANTSDAGYDAPGSIGGAAGDMPGSTDLERAANKVRAVARKAQAKVEDKVHTFADQLAGGVSTLAERGLHQYERTSARAKEMAGKVEPMVRERPLAATGLALGAGVALGLLLAGRRTKVVYVRPRP